MDISAYYVAEGVSLLGEGGGAIIEITVLIVVSLTLLLSASECRLRVSACSAVIPGSSTQ